MRVHTVLAAARFLPDGELAVVRQGDDEHLNLIVPLSEKVIGERTDYSFLRADSL